MDGCSELTIQVAPHLMFFFFFSRQWRRRPGSFRYIFITRSRTNAIDDLRYTSSTEGRFFEHEWLFCPHFKSPREQRFLGMDGQRFDRGWTWNGKKNWSNVGQGPNHYLWGYVCTISSCSNMPLHISTARAEIRNKIVPNGINGKYTV